MYIYSLYIPHIKDYLFQTYLLNLNTISLHKICILYLCKCIEISTYMYMCVFINLLNKTFAVALS